MRRDFHKDDLSKLAQPEDVTDMVILVVTQSPQIHTTTGARRRRATWSICDRGAGKRWEDKIFRRNERIDDRHRITVWGM